MVVIPRFFASDSYGLRLEAKDQYNDFARISQAGLLQAGGAFGNGGDSGPADIHQTKLAHQSDEVVQFGGGAGHFEDEGAERGIDHAGLEDIGDAQALDPALSRPGNLDQRQFALDMRAFVGQVAHPVDRHQPVELVLDLLDDHAGAAGHDGDARHLLLGIDLRDGEAFDVVATAGEQADDAGEHARLIVDQDGNGVLFDSGFHGTGLQVGSDGRWQGAWRPAPSPGPEPVF